MHDFKLVETQTSTLSLALNIIVLITSLIAVGMLAVLIITKTKSKTEKPNFLLEVLPAIFFSLTVIYCIYGLCSDENKFKIYEGVFKVADASKSKIINQDGERLITIEDNHNHKQIINIANDSDKNFKQGDLISIKEKHRPMLFNKYHEEKPTIKEPIYYYDSIKIIK